MRFLWDKPGEELLGHRIYTIWLNPDSLQDGGTSALSHQLFRGFPITHSSQHVALFYFLTFTNLIGIKWCPFVILICTAPVTSLNQFAFDLCDSVDFFSLVYPQLGMFPRPFLELPTSIIWSFCLVYCHHWWQSDVIRGKLILSSSHWLTWWVALWTCRCLNFRLQRPSARLLLP